ncbi:hypothetical protein U0070_002679 [Myodes glareolus]|uniref:Uncharacterized protein n=1 Tax=Myodes glareolus TaxID=447135 RepID=A0AAW0HL73_MYOGA
MDYNLKNRPDSYNLKNGPDNYNLKNRPDNYNLKNRPDNYNLKNRPDNYNLKNRPDNYNLKNRPDNYNLKNEPKRNRQMSHSTVPSSNGWLTESQASAMIECTQQDVVRPQEKGKPNIESLEMVGIVLRADQKGEHELSTIGMLSAFAFASATVSSWKLLTMQSNRADIPQTSDFFADHLPLFYLMYLLPVRHWAMIPKASKYHGSMTLVHNYFLPGYCLSFHFSSHCFENHNHF